VSIERYCASRERPLSAERERERGREARVSIDSAFNRERLVSAERPVSIVSYVPFFNFLKADEKSEGYGLNGSKHYQNSMSS
jgi:hypothetical protein